jgi:glycosyltransferase involved in cell wall biosynthesis
MVVSLKDDNTIRVLHVLGSLNAGGVETMLMDIYRNIDRNKIQFCFAIHKSQHCDYSDEIESLGGEIYSVPAFSGVNIFEYVNAWNVLLSQHPEIDIVYGHVRSTGAIYLGIAKKFGKITVAHGHSTSNGKGIVAFIKDIMQFPIRYEADFLFACSINAGEWLFGKSACKKDNFRIVKNAIIVERFSYDPVIRDFVRRNLHIEDKFVVGHTGRFCYPKNHIFLLEIFREIYSRNENTVLLLIGSGKKKETIEKRVNALGLTNNVIFLGTRSDVSDLLQAMDVFVFPSFFEGFATSVIEAQASGLHCIVSDRLPSEVFITSLVEKISLNVKPDIWAEASLKRDFSEERKNMALELRTSGYDIFGLISEMEEFYTKDCQILKKNI